MYCEHALLSCHVSSMTHLPTHFKQNALILWVIEASNALYTHTHWMRDTKYSKKWSDSREFIIGNKNHHYFPLFWSNCNMEYGVSLSFSLILFLHSNCSVHLLLSCGKRQVNDVLNGQLAYTECWIVGQLIRRTK